MVKKNSAGSKKNMKAAGLENKSKYKQENMTKFNKRVFDNADFVYETKNNICAVTVKTNKKENMVADKKRYFKKDDALKNSLVNHYGKPINDGNRKWYK